MSKRQSVKKTDILTFILLWGGYTVLMLLLFHRQTVNYAGKYESDMGAYVYYIQGIKVGYEYPYPIMFWLARLLQPVLPPAKALAFSVTALNSLTPLALKWCWDRRLGKEGHLKAICGNLLLFALLFVSMLFPLSAEAGVDYRYKGVFTPNPFHNATYVAARGFSIVAFFAFLELLETFRGEVNRGQSNREAARKYLLFSVSLLLTTMTKPSFTLGFVATCGLLLVVWWIRDGFGAWKFYVTIGICFIPTFIDLLYQYQGVFTGQNTLGQEQGIGFGWLDAWHTATDNVPEAIVLGLAFPLIVLLCNLKELKKNLPFRFAWEMMAVNLVMMMCLYEKGFRLGHMNFAWGYMCGMFFVYLVSLMLLVENTWRKAERENPKRYLCVLQWFFFGLHLICGIIYFMGIIQGGSFV